jgi:hypothetical protein
MVANGEIFSEQDADLRNSMYCSQRSRCVI